MRRVLSLDFVKAIAYEQSRDCDEEKGLGIPTPRRRDQEFWCFDSAQRIHPSSRA